MALVITLSCALVAVVLTFLHRPCIGDFGGGDTEKAKLREFIALDIRAASQYCYWYLALLGVSATIVASAANRELYKALLNWEHLWPFTAAFAAGSFALLFIPAGYGSNRFNRLRLIWFRSILCEQIVVIFTAYGAWEAFKALAAS
jgi:hypothetical protein